MDESEHGKPIVLSLELNEQEIDALKNAMIFELTTKNKSGPGFFRHDSADGTEVKLLIVNKDILARQKDGS